MNARTALAPLVWPARGLARTARAVNRWRTDQRNQAAYDAALAAKPGDYQALRDARDALIRRRTVIVLLVAWALGCFVAWQTVLDATIGLPGVTVIPPEWAPFIPAWSYPGAEWRFPVPARWWLAAGGAVMVGVTAAGIPHARTDKTAVIVKDERPGIAPPVSADAIVRAFAVAMPAVKRALEADPGALTLIGPVTRDGPGWAATVDLPLSMTTFDCIRARENLASALRVMGDQLYLSPGRHAGQCRLWVSDKRPEEMPDVDWPHARQASLSLTEPVTIGATAKGGPVTLSLATKSPDGRTVAGGSMLVGGVSGSGKTTFMRLIVSAAALHPEATIAIFDGKGDGDYKALEPVCDWLRIGASPTHLSDLHAMLVQAQEVMAKRQKGRAEKTPLLIVIDEVQRVKNKETQAVIEDLLRIGRSSGIFLVLATQKPSAETLPTDLRDSVRTRVCLRVPNQATNDMILGTGAYSEGRDATKFTRGMGLVMDVDTDAVDVVRVANVTDEIAGRIAAAHAREPGRMFTEPRSREIEEPALEPEAEAETPVGGSLVDQLRMVWPDGQDRIATVDLAGLIGWEQADLTRALKDQHGILTRPLWIDKKTQRGLERADLESAAVRP